MNKLTAGLLTAALILTGAQAFSGDTQADPMSKDKMMSDCMSRMTAKNDGSTKDQMMAACKAEMKKGMNKDSMSKDSMNKDNMSKDSNTPPPR